MKTDWRDVDGTVATVNAVEVRGGTCYTIVFTYKVDGSWYGGTFTGNEAYQEGDSIAVRYDPRNPERNDLVEKEKHKTWIIAGVIAAAVVAVVLRLVLAR